MSFSSQILLSLRIPSFALSVNPLADSPAVPAAKRSHPPVFDFESSNFEDPPLISKSHYLWFPNPFIVIPFVQFLPDIFHHFL